MPVTTPSSYPSVDRIARLKDVGPFMETYGRAEVIDAIRREGTSVRELAAAGAPIIDIAVQELAENFFNRFRDYAHKFARDAHTAPVG